MLGAIVRGFLLGPIVLVVVALLWAKASMLAAVLLALFVVCFGAAIVGTRKPSALPVRRPAQAAPIVRRTNATMTSTARPVTVNARENLASTNRWRRRFDGWRYTPPQSR